MSASFQQTDKTEEISQQLQQKGRKTLHVKNKLTRKRKLVDVTPPKKAETRPRIHKSLKVIDIVDPEKSSMVDLTKIEAPHEQIKELSEHLNHLNLEQPLLQEE